ncbi:MAG: hypothetical protein AAGC44_15865 [Planctomycetota bacterium]
MVKRLHDPKRWVFVCGVWAGFLWGEVAQAEFVHELVIDDFSSVGADSSYPYTSTNPSDAMFPFRGASVFFEEFGVPGTLDGRRKVTIIAGPADEPRSPESVYETSAVLAHDPADGAFAFNAAEDSAARWILFYNTDARVFRGDRVPPESRRTLDTSPYSHVRIEYEVSHDSIVYIELGSHKLDSQGLLQGGPASSGLYEVGAQASTLLVPLDSLHDSVRAYDWDSFDLVEQPRIDLSKVEYIAVVHQVQYLDSIPGGMDFKIKHLSFVAVPEPGTSSLLLLMSIGLLRCRW